MVIFASIVLGLAASMCILFASNDEHDYMDDYMLEKTT